MRQYRHSIPIVIVSMFALTWWTPLVKADVDVCGTVTLSNNTGQAANDVHFHMYQNDRPGVHVTGSSASSNDCSSTTATTDPGGVDSHGAQVDASGCDIPPGGSVRIRVCLTMTERNSIKFEDIYFTQDGTPIPPGGGGGGGGPPEGGWRIHRPFPGGNGGNTAPGGGGQGAQQGGGGGGNWVHRVCYENDDTVPIEILELRLTSAMPLYNTDTLDMSTSIPIDDPANPYPICIPPGGSYCYDFNTTGSYLDGHVYQKWIVRKSSEIDCSGGGNSPIGGSALPAGAPPEEDPNAMQIVGDHPVEALMTDCLDGRDYLHTVDPTDVTFGAGSLPQIPADFFSPGSQPFYGTVQLHCNCTGVDTIVERLAIAYLDNIGSSDTIPIQLTALSLHSLNPITVTSTNSTPSSFDVLQPMTHIGQPPVQIHLSNDGGTTVHGIRDLGFQNAGPPGLMLRGEAHDSAGPPGDWAIDSFFDVFFESTPEVPGLPPNFFFDVFFELKPPGGGTEHFSMPTPPQVSWSDSFFDITYRLSLDGGATENLYHVHAQINPNQPLSFNSVQLGPDYNGVDSFFDVFCDMTTDGGGWTALQPLMTLQMNGDNQTFVDSFFDVFVTLDSVAPQPIGSMTITKTHANGGTFDSSFPVRPKFIFTEVVNPSNAPVLDGPIIQLDQLDPYPWTYTPSAGFVIDSPATNFYPGVYSWSMQWIGSGNEMKHTVIPATTPPVATQWRSVRSHTGLGDLPILLNPAATGNGVSGPTVETRNGGLRTCQIDLDQPVTIVVPFVSVIGRLTIGGVMQPPNSYTPSSISMIDPDTLQIEFLSLPDQACYNIDISGAVANGSGQPVAGDTDCNIRALFCDTNMTGGVNLGDMLATKAKIGQPATANVQHDVNLTGGNINLGDALQVKSRTSPPAKNALCP